MVQYPWVLQHSLVEVDHEIFPTVILSDLLIQGCVCGGGGGGQLSVSGYGKVHKYRLAA